MKKILFICTEGFDTPGPSNHLISTLIEDLLENGFQVTLVQSRRLKVNEDIPENLKERNKFKAITIDRKVISKSSFIKRYLEEVYYNVRAFRKWKDVKGIDAVFVQSSPTVIFPIMLVKIFTNHPILYSVQDMCGLSTLN